MNKYSVFKEPPAEKGNVQVLCLQRVHQQSLKCVSTLLLTSLMEPLQETVVCKYLFFNGDPNSNCNNFRGKYIKLDGKVL